MAPILAIPHTPPTIPFPSPLPSSACSFLNLPSPRLAFHPKKKLSCRATANKDNQSPRSEDSNINSGASRRDILISLGGLYAANSKALAAPIQAPDLSKCGPPDVSTSDNPVVCCPPISSIVEFEPPSPYAPLRVRRPAHLVDDEYLKKYEKAVKLMKALPEKDPRNFTQQANIHCAYCDKAYKQVDFPDVPLQVHASWHFFPWHRIYLYFHERILGKLIGDDTFALPFWNWDARDGMRLPSIYTNTHSSLYDPLRDPDHQPPTIIDLDFSEGPTSDVGQQDQIDKNLKTMHRQVITGGPTAELFMGLPLRAGGFEPGAGSLENSPHGTVHTWTGDSRQKKRENMGIFYAAGRDPIFYAHHSNIDRLWTVWKTLGGQRHDFTDSDWLDATFLFYDENARLVKVKVRDFLDTEKLRYKYADVKNEWINTPPTRTGTGRPVTPRIQPTFPLSLQKPNNVSISVGRPERKGKTGKEVEVLVVEGIEFDMTVFTKFDVYVNATSDSVLTAAAAECAGTFVHLPHRVREGKATTMKTGVQNFAITDLLKEIGAEGDNSVVVTLVPRAGTVKIDGISIVLLT